MLLFLLQAASEPATWNEVVIAKATVVMAVATVVYVITTVLLWLTTRQSVIVTRNAFESSHRPFIGVSTIDRQVFSDPPRLRITLRFKNAGSVPANDVKVSLRVVADGIILPDKVREEEESAIIIPGDTQLEIITIDDPKHYESAANATILSLLFKCTYKGVTQKEYVYEQKLTYNKEHGGFSGIKGIAT